MTTGEADGAIRDAIETLTRLGAEGNVGARRASERAARDWEEERLDRAIKALRKGARHVEERKARSRLLVDVARALYAASRFGDAQEVLDEALEQDYENALAWRGLAYSRHVTGNYSSAVDAYLRYLEIGEADYEVLLNFGALMQELGHLNEALQYYEQAEKFDPEEPNLLANRGLALYDLGRFHEAKENLERASHLSDEAEIHRLLGLTLQALGDEEAAKVEYEKAVSVNPENAQALHNDAVLSLELEDYATAVDRARASADAFLKDPEDPDFEGAASALWNLGWAHYKLEAWDDAIEANKRALEFDPDLLPVRFNLGLAYLHAGNLAQAITEYRRGMIEVSDASDLEFDALYDLKEALEEQPELHGGRTILEMLEQRLKELHSTRTA